MEQNMQPIQSSTNSKASIGKVVGIIIIVLVVIIGLKVGKKVNTDVINTTETASSTLPSNNAATTTSNKDTKTDIKAVGPIVKKGNEVDKVVQDAVIESFLKQKSIYASGKVSEIKKLIINSTPEAERKTTEAQLSKMSDESLLKMVALINSVMIKITPEIMRSQDMSWTFNSSMDHVKIERIVPPGDTTGVSNVSIEFTKVNGQWQ